MEENNKKHAGEGVGKGEPLVTVGRNENCCGHYGNQCLSFSKSQKPNFNIENDPATPLSVC